MTHRGGVVAVVVEVAINSMATVLSSSKPLSGQNLCRKKNQLWTQN